MDVGIDSATGVLLSKQAKRSTKSCTDTPRWPLYKTNHAFRSVPNANDRQQRKETKEMVVGMYKTLPEHRISTYYSKSCGREDKSVEEVVQAHARVAPWLCHLDLF